jgi:hypothetical protein
VSFVDFVLLNTAQKYHCTVAKEVGVSVFLLFSEPMKIIAMMFCKRDEII